MGASPKVSWVGPDGLAPGHEWALGGQLLGRGSWVSLPLWGSPEYGLGLCCKEVADAAGGFHREPSPVLILPVVRRCHQKVPPVQCGGWWPAAGQPAEAQVILAARASSCLFQGRGTGVNYLIICRGTIALYQVFLVAGHPLQVPASCHSLGNSPGSCMCPALDRDPAN